MFKYELSLNDDKKIYAFSELEYQLGEKVIVQGNGEEMSAIITKFLGNIDEPLEFSIKQNIEFQEEKNDMNYDLLMYANKNISKLNLSMKIIKIDHNEKEQLIKIYFLSNNRVDFRELLKILSSKYKKKIEFKQVGARDKAKMVGGLGPCGQFLCCNLYLQNFEPISINMAKNQMLALNPSKINGQCGRLLCCLSYEDEIYSALKKELPLLGSQYKKGKLEGRVVELNILKKSFVVQSNNERIEIFLKEE